MDLALALDGGRVAQDRAQAARIISGDARAAQELVSALQPRVLRQAWRATGDRHSAEDITQDVFAKVFTKLHTYRGEQPLEHWVLRITTATCIDALRRRRDTGVLSEAQAWSGPDPSREAETAALRREVRAAVMRLPRDCQEAIWLTVFDDMTYDQAAAVLRVPMRTLMSRVARARAQLRRSLKGMELMPA